jgi:hypothetical protein
MPFDKLDWDELSRNRRDAMAKSIRTVPLEELKKFGEELFPHHDHPWRETYFAFLAQNPSATVHHAVTNDGVNVLYCREEDKGIWFLPGQGIGPLQKKGRETMKKIIERG